MELFPDYIIKHFSDPWEYRKEYAMYCLHLPMLPVLLDYEEDKSLKLQRIYGQPYMDNPNGFNPEVLAATIASFHLATLQDDTCICQFDNQPANILQNEEGFHLIDFGDSRRDYPELDISHLLLFWAADVPSVLFSNYCELFLAEYAKHLTLNDNRWRSYLDKNIQAFDNRRRLYNKPGGKNLPEIQLSNRLFLQNYSFTRKTH